MVADPDPPPPGGFVATVAADDVPVAPGAEAVVEVDRSDVEDVLEVAEFVVFEPPHAAISAQSRIS